MLRELPGKAGAFVRDDAAAVGEHPMRKVTRQVAFEPGGWTAERRRKVAELFDGLAPAWNDRDDLHRAEALRDALERGGPYPAGLCVEAGSGTGLVTRLLVDALGPVLAVDIAFEMLRMADVGWRVLADASGLPLPDGAAATVVLHNAFLFPAEVARVLRPDGMLLWVNTVGPSTPIHLTGDEVQKALGDAWDGVASAAGPGTWAVFRRR